MKHENLVDNILPGVRELGRRLLEWRGTGAEKGEWVGTQLKTEADIRAHMFLSEHLKKITPDIEIISEEDLSNQKENRPANYWLIDPIDGTASYSEGFDGFVVQLALMKHCEPVISVVYAPGSDELFTAQKGCGSFLNEKRLAVDNNRTSMVLIDNYPEPRGRIKNFYDSVHATGYVESGSIGLKICRIADGSADLFVKDVVVRDWDIAPGHLIIEEAGGYISDVGLNNFDYKGSFERKGVIASRSKNIAENTATWFDKF